MSLKKMSKEDLELLSNKDITSLILEESKKSKNTADLFKKIIELLELPASTFEKKIGDYYTSLATDKRFILLEDGTWDLRSRHTSDKVVKIADEDDRNSRWMEELFPVLEMSLKIASVMIKEKDKNFISYESWVSNMEYLMDDASWISEVIETAISPISGQLQKNQNIQ